MASESYHNGLPLSSIHPLDRYEQSVKRVNVRAGPISPRTKEHSQVFARGMLKRGRFKHKLQLDKTTTLPTCKLDFATAQRIKRFNPSRCNRSSAQQQQRTNTPHVIVTGHGVLNGNECLPLWNVAFATVRTRITPERIHARLRATTRPMHKQTHARFTNDRTQPLTLTQPNHAACSRNPIKGDTNRRHDFHLSQSKLRPNIYVHNNVQRQLRRHTSNV